MQHDSAVRSTDSDALISRYSAHSLAYLVDPFCAHFVARSLLRTPSASHRPPLINLGTHARTWAVDELVRQFLETTQTSGGQVLSVGAGTDTRFWRMRDEWERRAREWTCRKWVEVDFEEATGAKCRVVATKRELKDRIGRDVKIEQGGLALSSELYALLPLDLRSPASTLTSTLVNSRILDPTIPTLLLAECVFIYLTPTVTSSLLSWFTSTFSTAGASVLSYDPFGLHDSFGTVMKRNLAERNLCLPSADDTPTLESLRQRLEASGFAETKAMSIREIRQYSIPQIELTRIAAIERIDEVEELNLVLEHYAISWGTTQSPSASNQEWGLRNQRPDSSS